MSLPKFGSVIERRHAKTGKWEVTFILLSSKKPVVFLFTRDGEVLQMSQFRFEAMLSMKTLRVMEDVLDDQ